MQIWLQMFAWSEATKPRVLWQRATGGSHQRSLMEREPLFCMETAIKMLYFSGMAYEHDEVGGAAQLLVQHASVVVWAVVIHWWSVCMETDPIRWTVVQCAEGVPL